MCVYDGLVIDSETTILGDPCTLSILSTSYTLSFSVSIEVQDFRLEIITEYI